MKTNEELLKLFIDRYGEFIEDMTNEKEGSYTFGGLRNNMELDLYLYSAPQWDMWSKIEKDYFLEVKGETIHFHIL